MKAKQIIAIGGGGFGRETNKGAVERYILAASGKETPKICFLPQATAEDPAYIAKFYRTFSQLNAVPSDVSLFGRIARAPSLEDILLDQDIIYVGGGNTKSMLALWKEWGVDVILQKAYEKGIVLCGVSAGAICWFEQSISDSLWPPMIVDGLGLVEGSCCPHFDSEAERQEFYRNSVNSADIKPGYALEDCTFLHYKDAECHYLRFERDKLIRKIEVANETEIVPDTIDS